MELSSLGMLLLFMIFQKDHDPMCPHGVRMRRLQLVGQQDAASGESTS